MSGATPPSAKKQKIDLSDTYTIIVGAEKKEMIVHKDVLGKTSDFLAVYCGQRGFEWKEQKDRIIELPEDDPEMVSYYLSWLYTGSLAVIDEGHPADLLDRHKSEKIEFARIGSRRLFKLAILSDKFGDNSFTNIIMDSMLTICNDFRIRSGLGRFCEDYNQLPEASPMRRLLRDLWLHPDHETLTQLERHRANMPPELTFDMLMDLMRGQVQAEKGCPRMRNRCEYHIHDDNTPKCK